MDYYQYRFVQNFTCFLESDYIEVRKLYTFRSNLSHQQYFVWIDKCKHNLYVIKFHLKNHRYSQRRYNILTNLHEARTIVFTCISILLNEVYSKEKSASFGFIASNLENEDKYNTKRLCFYSSFITTFIGYKTFQHFKYIDRSAYLLIPHNVIQETPNIINNIEEMFNEHDFIECDT